MGWNRILLLAALAGGCASAGGVATPAPRFPVLEDGDAWAALSGDPPPLPSWARILAGPLPATTALQVDLDHLHRRRNPLGPALAARVRLAVAEANRCEYSRESALADLAAAEAAAPRAATAGGGEEERLALEFARRLTLEASAIGDDEVAALLAALGPEDVVALVHTVAHANFQDRILLALGLEAEPGGAAKPCETRPPADGAVVPRPRVLPPPRAAKEGGESPAWEPRSREELLGRLALQKERTARIPDPDAARLARLPRPGRNRPKRVVWGAVTMPYQPEMTSAWFRTMAAFEEEAGLDEVFTHSVFWVVTRTSDCFY